MIKQTHTAFYRNSPNNSLSIGWVCGVSFPSLKLLFDTDSALLIHRSSRSPFPAGERLMVRTNSFDLQLTSDIAIIMFWQIGIF